jgi:hypothetical protein
MSNPGKTPEDKPEVKPQEIEEEPEEEVEEEVEAKEPGVEIESRPIQPVSEIARNEKQRKEALVREVLANVTYDLADWLLRKDNVTLSKLSRSETVDVMIDYVNDITTKMTERARKLGMALQRLAALTGQGGGVRGRLSGRQAIEEMLYERLAQSFGNATVQGIEAQSEAQRRKRLTEEVLREITERSRQQDSGEGGGK